MEQDLKNPQFDSLLGGNQKIPTGLNVSEFIKHRMEEVVMLTEAIEESPFRGQAFQRLPKHMRRRQMSHYIKRLPRRLQRPYLMSLKDEPPAPTKRPSRKFRRRPGNLLLEYNRRQKNSVWLETHIWHAKRYHMITKWGYKLPEKPVNKSFKACYHAISEHCLLIDISYYNCIELKGPRSQLLEGLKQCTSTDCGLTFGAKMYLNGFQEGYVTLFHPNSYPYQVIGNVTFMWQPATDEDGERKIWIWVHPQMHNEVAECFKLLFDLSDIGVTSSEQQMCKKSEKTIWLKQSRIPKNGDKRGKIKNENIKLEPKNIPFIRTPKFVNKSKSVTMTLLKDTLNRFQLTGPLSQAIISQAFTVASIGTFSQEVQFLGVETKKRKIDVEFFQDLEEIKLEKTDRKRNWWEKFCNEKNILDAWFDQEKYAKISECSRPNDMPSGMILGIVIEDPRLRIPAKKEKAVPEIEDLYQKCVTEIEPSYSQSPIWIPEVRDEVSLTKLTTQEINEARSKKIVPGFDAKDVIPDEKQSRIPILLVQRPGRRESRSGKLGFGSGWDIIAPAGFGMPIWLSLIFRGARTGGLRESELLWLEGTKLNGFLPPDSAGGEIENRRNMESLKTRFFKLPPNKRTNFTKLGIVCPFYHPWKILIRDWILRLQPKTEKTELEKLKFKVLRNYKILREINEIVNKFTKKGSDYLKALDRDLDSLIPVVIECTGRGKPKDFALICIPEDKDFKNSGNSSPVEPPHIDENEKWRKILKLEHSNLLKSLKIKRKKDRAKLKEDFSSNLPGKINKKEIVKVNFGPSESHTEEYKAKMERLWLPQLENLDSIMDSCSRKIFGFIVKGEFSYSRSRGLGLGYVTLPGLFEVLDACQRNKSNAVVLVRNRNQVQYRMGVLKIATEQ